MFNWDSKRRAVSLVIILMLCLVGCRSTKTEYLHQTADLGVIQSVAVLPFESLADDPAAAEKVQRIFYLEVLALDVFEVREPGMVAKTVKAATVGTLGPEDFKKLGEDLNVDAVFMGTVVDFTESRRGSTSSPEVTIQLRLVETMSGKTFWSTSQSRSGASTSMRLFGVGGQSLTEAARELIRSQLDTLFR